MELRTEKGFVWCSWCNIAREKNIDRSQNDQDKSCSCSKSRVPGAYLALIVVDYFQKIRKVVIWWGFVLALQVCTKGFPRTGS